MSNIREVASKAGVSPATVSRVFRNPHLISRQTRRNVLDVAALLNYQPQQGRTKEGPEGGDAEVAQALGFLYFAVDVSAAQMDNFYTPVMMGAQAEASRTGRHLLLQTVPRFERPAEMPKMLQEQAVAGVLLVGAALPEVLAEYEQHLPPAVLIDNRDETGRYDCVLSDGFGGTFAATRHLLELGHKRIAFVTHETTAPSVQDRQHGYLCALYEAGIVPPPGWVVSTPRSATLIEPYLGPLLTAPDRPTAIVTANDFLALAVLVACRSLGLRVPQDVSVMGFDDTPFSLHAYPPLTTMGVNKEHMGRLAVRQLIARIEESRDNLSPLPATHLISPVSLVQRDSCAPPQKEA